MKSWIFSFGTSMLPMLFVLGCTRRPEGGYMQGWGHMMGPGGYGGTFMWLILIIVVGVVIYFVLNRSRGAASLTGGSKEPPLDILKRRYAEGEISKEEFERMKDEINK
jgi:putative membrane protein